MLHPLLSARRSPARFDSSDEVSDEALDALLEAARWAPSAGNSQPWSFIFARRGADTRRRVEHHLANSSRAWAPAAALLVVNLAHRWVEDTDWELSEFALYDLGQAVAHMTIQAQALGMACRQFRAFDREGLTAEFEVPQHWQVVSMTAVGRPQADPDAAVATPAGPEPRSRRPARDLMWGASTTQRPR
ncbi:nitroreductase family protein [Acidiferrimicrobium sp. IK]|uniref:nitroreductase family protein n=1 Tax=Acidiferrimicrobium sp. IK TaxID=2871700 RepID=UPI0039678E8D